MTKKCGKGEIESKRTMEANATWYGSQLEKSRLEARRNPNAAPVGDLAQRGAARHRDLLRFGSKLCPQGTILGIVESPGAPVHSVHETACHHCLCGVGSQVHAAEGYRATCAAAVDYRSGNTCVVAGDFERKLLSAEDGLSSYEGPAHECSADGYAISD